MGIKEANTVFLEGAKTVLYNQGSYWKKHRTETFSFIEHDYMRSLEGAENTYLFVIDIDSLVGFNKEVFQCAIDLYNYFGDKGVLKASGVKGMHAIPFHIRFPDNFEDKDARYALLNLAYTAYMECDIKEKYEFPFLSRTTRTPLNEIKNGYLDTTMYNKGHMIRGFCRRYKNNRKINSWSVPVDKSDSFEAVLKTVHLDIEPNWNISIPTIQYDEKMILYTRPVRTKLRTAIKPISNLEGKDTVDKIAEKIYKEMPHSVMEIWDSEDPSHKEKFGVVCWLNDALAEIVPDRKKRARLISELVENHMALTRYRETERISPTTIEYQVNHIVSNAYSCPGWLLEDQDYEEWVIMIEGLAKELVILGKEDFPATVLEAKISSLVHDRDQEPYFTFKNLMAYPGLDLLLIVELAEKNLYPEEILAIMNREKPLDLELKDTFFEVFSELISIGAIEYSKDRKLKPSNLTTYLERYDSKIHSLWPLLDKTFAINWTMQGSEWLDRFRDEVIWGHQEQTIDAADKEALIFEYHDNYFERGFGTCEWMIYLPVSVNWDFLKMARDRTDRVVSQGSTMRHYIKRMNKGEKPPVYMLVIQGRGKDNRCTWCRSFRTYCKSTSTSKGINLVEKGGCTFK